MSRPFRPDCPDERHIPSARSVRTEGDMRRATCRCCGCALVRTLAMRRWYRSGVLGAVG